MKILIGTFEIGRHMYDLADGFRALGHEADTAVIYRNPQHPDLQYTFQLPERFVLDQITELQNHPLDALVKRGDHLMFVRKLLTEYDLYVFQFASSLMPGNADYPLLKQLGKKLACVFLGSEIRHWSGSQPVCSAYGMTPPGTVWEEPYNHLDTRLSNLRMAERYADAIFSLPFQSELAVRPYWHLQIPMDLANYQSRVPDREVPVVVHAPTRRNFKGTPAVLGALERLRDEGVAFELKLLENVPNADVLKALTDADLVIDQLHAPHYGILALEGMASGCAIIGGNVPDYVPFVRQSPVVHATEDTIYETARNLLVDRALRTRLGESGRSYVEAYHDHTQVAQTILEKVDLHSAFEYYPTFYTTGYELPDGETPHLRIRQITSEIIARHGLPADADPELLVKKQLVDGSLLDYPLVRWTPLVSNTKQEIWGWSPLHTNDEASLLDRRAILVEATLEVRRHVENGALQSAVDLFQQCIAEIQDEPSLLEDENALVALAVTAATLELEDEAASFLEKGLTLFPGSQTLQHCEALIGRDEVMEPVEG